MAENGPRSRRTFSRRYNRRGIDLFRWSAADDLISRDRRCDKRRKHLGGNQALRKGGLAGGETRDRCQPRAFVLVLRLSTAYAQPAETHHDQIMNPTAAVVTQVCRPWRRTPEVLARTEASRHVKGKTPARWRTGWGPRGIGCVG
jgi:hypothetical protein